MPARLTLNNWIEHEASHRLQHQLSPALVISQPKAGNLDGKRRARADAAGMFVG
ncbi:hypothetical protein N2599_06455 [Rhizobium sullae]|uniref:Uncharacterized protein n=1 Tax=Rhizobium sullae TaxID=50338 RepID=A0ABY5XNH4_RHISU|nr:hypothetical protein [Rhizobium sullae]UWU15636.1 hypothetical protein N2599_06455 [Rhizobium sullae]